MTYFKQISVILFAVQRQIANIAQFSIIDCIKFIKIGFIIRVGGQFTQEKL